MQGERPQRVKLAGNQWPISGDALILYTQTRVLLLELVHATHGPARCPTRLADEGARGGEEGDLGEVRVVLVARVEEGEECEHGEEGGDREDVDGGRGFLADGDLLVGYVVTDREGLSALALALSMTRGWRGRLGRTVAMPIQPGSRSRASRKPPRRERTVEVM